MTLRDTPDDAYCSTDTQVGVAADAVTASRISWQDPTSTKLGLDLFHLFPVGLQ